MRKLEAKPYKKVLSGFRVQKISSHMAETAMSLVSSGSTWPLHTWRGAIPGEYFTMADVGGRDGYYKGVYDLDDFDVDTADSVLGFSGVIVA